MYGDIRIAWSKSSNALPISPLTKYALPRLTYAAAVRGSTTVIASRAIASSTAVDDSANSLRIARLLVSSLDVNSITFVKSAIAESTSPRVRLCEPDFSRSLTEGDFCAQRFMERRKMMIPDESFNIRQTPFYPAGFSRHELSS